MNVRLQLKLNFRAMVHFQQHLAVNHYHVTLDITTACEDGASQNIAMDRMVYFLQTCLGDSVMISESDHAQIRLYKDAGMKITTLPTEPVDQIIGIMLYCKLNAIMEGRMYVTQVSLCSDQGDHVWYLHNNDESLGVLSETGWWHDATPRHCQSDADQTTVVNLMSQSVWSRADLDWPLSESTDKKNSKVLFAKFQHADDE